MEVPKSMVEDEIDRMANELDQQLRYQGMGLNQYLEFVGKNIAEFREEPQTGSRKNRQDAHRADGCRCCGSSAGYR